MQLPQMPYYCPINAQGIIQAGGVGPPQNIMVSSGTSSAGQMMSAPTSYYYPGSYTGRNGSVDGLVFPSPFADPTRFYSIYPPGTPVNPAGVNANWQMTRSPPHQQQQQPQVTDQQRAYAGAGAGQNIVTQALPPTGAPNAAGIGGRSTSTSGPSGQPGTNGPPMTPQYTFSGGAPATYAYGPSNAWLAGPQQVSSPQTNMPPQVNAYGMMFDPTQQQLLQQQGAYVHPNPYEAAYFQQVQQQAPQQGLDAVPPGNYNR